jgi:hypothetical protein
MLRSATAVVQSIELVSPIPHAPQPIYLSLVVKSAETLPVDCSTDNPVKTLDPF